MRTIVFDNMIGLFALVQLEKINDIDVDKTFNNRHKPAYNHRLIINKKYVKCFFFIFYFLNSDILLDF